MIAPGIFITGDSYEKFSLFYKFLGLASVSRSTCMRIQKKYVVPEVERFWKDMKASIWKTFNGESIVLCADGRNDSPGHSAKYCVYVLMEQFVRVVVDIDVVDKRETGGVSTNIEVYGIKKLLERVVGEIVCDRDSDRCFHSSYCIGQKNERYSWVVKNCVIIFIKANE